MEIITVAKVDLDRMRQLSATVPGHLDRVTDQHAAIVDAVKRGKADQAELAMRIHLDPRSRSCPGCCARAKTFS